jgi:16S rRNA (guanine966-N2)-methyltransferase
MRVTGGALRGRRLRAPRAGVRPTADRVREATFMRLGPLDGSRVLDLYAGSGALGIEALSRGAAHVVFVERSHAALVALRANLEELDLGERATVVRGDAVKTVGRLGARGERFHLVLLDPPYAEGASAALRALAEAGVLAPGARVVSESAKREPVYPVAGLALLDERCYGDTRITRWLAGTGSSGTRRASPAEAGPDGGRPPA